MKLATLIALALIPSLSLAAERRPQPPSPVCIEGATGNTCGPTKPVGKKWNPGHYQFARPPQDTTNTQTPDFALSSSNPNFRGAMVGYSWGMLEPARGKYDFSRIRAHRDALAAKGRRLIIWLQDRSPSGSGPATTYSSRFTPSYLNTPEFGGGWAPYRFGQIAKFWIPSVCAREVALIQALGNAFDGDPNVEGIVMNFESAVGTIRSPDYTWAGNRACLERFIDAGAAAWPRTNVFVSLNFASGGPESDMQALVSRAAARHIGVYGPDFLPPHASTTAHKVLTGALGGVDYRERVPLALRYGDASVTDMCASEGVSLVPSYALTHVIWISNPSTIGTSCQQWPAVTSAINGVPVAVRSPY